ncbi:hypothetical protein GCM10022210_11190 [Mucilaginibacter dorajii]|uniref:Uncharacterized protein n=1 Tax=Mucilaginibacter dorajii TaxID=692994 RepID=A0ABP7PF25_9SPHI
MVFLLFLVSIDKIKVGKKESRIKSQESRQDYGAENKRSHGSELQQYWTKANLIIVAIF